MTLLERLRRLWRLPRTVHRLEQRLATLERQVAEAVDTAEQLRALGSRTVGGKPNTNYFNERFRDYELALLNIKSLGYELGRVLTERLPESGGAPAIVPMTSRLCSQRDMESQWVAFWTRELGATRGYHRHLWEHCFIAQALYGAGKLADGMTGLGFGCGKERLPSLFAKHGARILVTDLPPEQAAGKGWVRSDEHSASLEAVRIAEICPDPARLAGIDLRYMDMNAIPDDLHGGFDFCWSACALEHLGSIELGLAFIENSLKTLKPGGVAVHTLEFNLTESGETIDNWITVLFQKRHIVALAEKLTGAGYRVAELDFSRGDGVLDDFVDIPPWHSDVVALSNKWAQLKLSVDGFACTSFGIIIHAPT